MKYTYLFLLLSVFYSHSQNINCDEIIALKSKNVIEVEKFLNLKGWDLFSELKPTKNELGCTVFSLEKDSNENQDFSKSGSFIFYYFNTDFDVSKIELMTNSKKVYNSFLIRLKQLKYKNTYTKISEVKTYQTYENNKDIIQIEMLKNTASKKNYTITITNKNL